MSPPCRAHNPYNSTNQVGMAGRMITTQISQSVPYYVPSTHTTPILSSCFTVHYPTYLLSPSFHPASRPSFSCRVVLAPEPFVPKTISALLCTLNNIDKYIINVSYNCYNTRQSGSAYSSRLSPHHVRDS